VGKGKGKGSGSADDVPVGGVLRTVARALELVRGGGPRNDASEMGTDYNETN